jgi:serine-type D-Ala-D-Ala carboxypeptidase/endopeptidase (penicillin-binding protein 4)
MSIKKIFFIYVITIVMCLSVITSLSIGSGIIQQDIYQFKGFSGVLVQDLMSEEILISYNPDKLFTPASLVKIFTLLAGLEKLGQEYRYRTVFYFSSSMPGYINGDLFIKGYGDPTHSPETIRKIAHDLIEKYNIKQISGDIVLDDTTFSPEEFLGRGWMWDDQNPIIGSFAIKGESIAEPMISYYKKMSLSWGGIFCQELVRQGVIFDGKLRTGKLDENLSVKAIFYSETLDEMLTQMMKMSDNQSAETVFRTLALADDVVELSTIEHSIVSMSEILQETLLMRWGEEYVIVDGCGLSEYNLVTPAQVVRAISYLYNQYGTKILKYFANTRERGTIKERFPFQLWGKTGSLPSASGLAGIFKTKNKRDVIFCLIENNFSGEQNNPKTFEDNIVSYIYENY